MSNKEENTIDQEVITDPFAYGYAPGTLVMMPAELFMRNMQTLGAIAQMETKQSIIVDEFDALEGPELDENGVPVQKPERVVISTSVAGKQAADTFNENVNFHISQIEKGMTISREQAMANEAATPKLDLGN